MKFPTHAYSLIHGVRSVLRRHPMFNSVYPGSLDNSIAEWSVRTSEIISPYPATEWWNCAWDFLHVTTWLYFLIYTRHWMKYIVFFFRLYIWISLEIITCVAISFFFLHRWYSHSMERPFAWPRCSLLLDWAIEFCARLPTGHPRLASIIACESLHLLLQRNFKITFILFFYPPRLLMYIVYCLSHMML